MDKEYKPGNKIVKKRFQELMGMDKSNEKCFT